MVNEQPVNTDKFNYQPPPPAIKHSKLPSPFKPYINQTTMNHICGIRNASRWNQKVRQGHGLEEHWSRFWKTFSQHKFIVIAVNCQQIHDTNNTDVMTGKNRPIVRFTYSDPWGFWHPYQPPTSSMEMKKEGGTDLYRGLPTTSVENTRTDKWLNDHHRWRRLVMVETNPDEFLYPRNNVQSCTVSSTSKANGRIRPRGPEIFQCY